MILMECLYTSHEAEDDNVLRQQQALCCRVAHDYGWVITRQVFEPLLLSKCEMKDRTGIQAIQDDVRSRRFDLLMVAGMDRISLFAEEVKDFLAEMDLNGIALFNAGANRLTLAGGQTQERFIAQQITPEEDNNDGTMPLPE